MSISTKTAGLRRSAVSMTRILSAMLALILMIAPAFAIGVDLKKIQKLKEYEFIPQAKFEQATKKVDELRPYNEDDLSYTLRLPKNWTDNVQQPVVGAINQRNLSNSVPDILGRYVGAAKNLERSYLTVEAQKMTYEISAQNWFVNFIMINGLSLTALSEKSSREVEALYVQMEGDRTFIVRARVVVNASKMILVRYYLPQENYEQEKIQQAQIVHSFAVLDPSPEHIEKQATYGFLDQSYFNYPESWTLKERNILSIERMSALLFQASKDEKKVILDGHIKINVISRLLNTTMAEEIQKFRDNLKIKDYSLGDMIETVDYDYDPSIKSGKAQIYELVPSDPVNMKSYEFLVTVMQGDDYYYITSMITPSREQDFYAWAQNMEAARIVNETMRRNNFSLEIDPNDPYYDYLKDEPEGMNAAPVMEMPNAIQIPEAAPTAETAPATAPAPAPASAPSLVPATPAPESAPTPPTP